MAAAGRASRPARGADVALDTTGNPAVILAAVQSLATHGTASVITSSGAPVTLPPGDAAAQGPPRCAARWAATSTRPSSSRGCSTCTREGRFPVDRLVRNYPFAELNTAIADSLSGATIKPVLTF